MTSADKQPAETILVRNREAEQRFEFGLSFASYELYIFEREIHFPKCSFFINCES